jgi:hypothetical protein
MAENILHFGAVRLRITGTASLQMEMIPYDGQNIKTLKPLQIIQLPGKDLDRLCNVKAQRARLKISTLKINENIRVDKVIFYVKPVASQYPG